MNQVHATVKQAYGTKLTVSTIRFSRPRQYKTIEMNPYGNLHNTYHVNYRETKPRNTPTWKIRVFLLKLFSVQKIPATLCNTAELDAMQRELASELEMGVPAYKSGRQRLSWLLGERKREHALCRRVRGEAGMIQWTFHLYIDQKIAIDYNYYAFVHVIIERSGVFCDGIVISLIIVTDSSSLQTTYSHTHIPHTDIFTVSWANVYAWGNLHTQLLS